MSISSPLDLGVNNYSKEIYEDPDRIYGTLKGDENVANQPGTSPGAYRYPGSNLSSAGSIEDEYTYAKDTDFSRPENENSNDAVYNTLEQPEEPTDEFYNYPDNTNTAAKPPLSEQEYAYGKDTGIPRATSSDASPAISGNLYHTLEQEGSALPEQKYSYAMNTEVPIILQGTTQKTNALPGVPDNSALHRTPESNPLQAPVYSTLEEQEDSNNEQV